MKNYKRISRREFASTMIGAAGATGLAWNAGVSAENKRSATGSLRLLSKDFLARLPKIMEVANVPGVAVAYIEKGRVTWKDNYGVSNKKTGEPVTPETVWQVGSLGKPVFALGVMRLVEAGKLDLDKPLIDYLPAGEEIVKGDTRAKLITARLALSHSTGLQNWRFQAGQTLQLSFDPGSRWQYSGEGIYLVQRAVEEITGKGLETFARENIFAPLGMADSTYFWRPGYEKRIAMAHNGRGELTPDYFVANNARVQAKADEWKKPVAEWQNADQEKAQSELETPFPPFPTFFHVNAAGTLISPITDYAKFVAALLEAPVNKILSDASIAQVFKPQSRVNDVVSWGLGWGLQTASDLPAFWHWGEGMNYRTFVFADRVSRSGLVVFTNAANGRKVWERVLAEGTVMDQPLTWWL